MFATTPASPRARARARGHGEERGDDLTMGLAMLYRFADSTRPDRPRIVLIAGTNGDSRPVLNQRFVDALRLTAQCD